MAGADELPDFHALWNFNDPAETEKRFRELLPRAEESGDRSYHVQLLTQIARTQGLQRIFNDAHKTLDDAEKLLTDDMIVPRLTCMLERGRVYNSSNEKEKARPLFLEAWETGMKHHRDYYAIDAAHMMQIVEAPEKQLQWAEKAIALAEKTKDERGQKWLGPLYNNTGWSYHDLKQYEKALALFKKSLKWREEKKDEEGTRIAKWTIARTYRSMGKIDRAIEIQKKLEKEFEENGIQQDGYVFEELGECYLLKGEKEKAGIYFARAYDLLSKDEWLSASEPDRLKRMKALSSTESQK
jgi:tetratricopeptide (TPR) repeat protein